MSKHTPGPWRTGDNTFRDFGVDVSCVESGLPEPDGGPAHICTVGNADERMPHVANAKLIAAAPDLLKALQIADDQLCHATFYATGDQMPDLEWASNKARAAIAKATQ